MSKQKKNRFKTLFLISLGLFFLSLMVIFLWPGRGNKSKTQAKLEQKLQEKSDKISELNDILNAESHWLYDRNLEKAIRELKKIKPANESAQVEQRIDALVEIREELASDTMSLQQYKMQLTERNDEVKELKDQKDSIDETLNDQLSSVQNEKDSLLEVVQKKEKALKRKEDIKVISFKSTKGDQVHYLGEVENGKANGGGIGIWRTGSIYKGKWKNNKRHGEGTFEWADGQKYEGDFKNDVRTGKGTYYWPSGEMYEGEFRNNRREGQGTLYDPDGNVSFKGKWKDDKPLTK